MSTVSRSSSYANDKLIQLYRTKEYSDCTFVVGNERFAGHKFHLALCSPVFESMLYGMLSSNEIRIDDIDPKHFNLMLEYLYTDNIIFGTVEDACLMLYVAQKYLLQELMSAAIQYVKTHLNLFNLALCFEYGQLYNQKDLLQTCLSDILTYSVGVLFFTDYHMKVENFKYVLNESSDLENNTKVLAAIKWCLEDLELSNVDRNSQNLLNLLTERDLLNDLDFATYNRTSHINDLKSIPSFELLNSYAKLYSNTSNINLRNNRTTAQNLCYKYRKLLKTCLALRIHGTRRESVRSVIISDKTILLFGIAISTKSSPCNDPNIRYKGNAAISIFDNENRLCHSMLVTDDTAMYDSVQTVKFGVPLLFEKLKEYAIDISYNCDASYYSEAVLLTYMTDSIQPSRFSTGKVTFFETYGSVLHGISFYEL